LPQVSNEEKARKNRGQVQAWVGFKIGGDSLCKKTSKKKTKKRREGKGAKEKGTKKGGERLKPGRGDTKKRKQRGEPLNFWECD